MIWWKNLKGKIRFNEPLKKHTSFRLGGKGLIWFEPKDISDLINCFRVIRKIKIPYFVIGNGTNILVKDEGFKGIIIKLTSSNFKHISIEGSMITVGAGLSLRSLMRYLANINLTGYEFLAGIPGSIGGALVMNAGVTDGSRRCAISDIVYKIKVLDKNGKILDLDKEGAGFSYRNSKLGGYIILEAKFRLVTGDYIKVKNRIRNFLLFRQMRQDNSKPNAGCVFKNPSKNFPAGKLIDECGLKGKHFGGAMISSKHANFILNFNSAKARDVIELIRIVKKRVKDKFGINLKEEIKIV